MNRAAASNSATTASRSRSAAAPAGPPRGWPAPTGRPARWLPDRPEHVLGGRARRRRRAVAGGRQQPGHAAAAGRAARRLEGRAVRAGRRAASTSSGPDARPPPAASSARRSAWRSRRRPSTSAPPSGEVSSSTTVVLVERSRAGSRSRSSEQQRARPRAAATSGTSSPATATGTPAATSARRSTGIACTVERTSTAICDHGTPSTRCACAQPVGDVAPPPATRSAARATASSPGGQALAGQQVPVLGADRGSRAATRRLAASSAGAGPRGRSCSATTGAGSPAAVRKRVGEARDAGDVGAAEAVDRLVGVADRDQVAAVAGEQPQQLDLRRVGVLQLVDEHVRPGRALGARAARARCDPEADDRADQLGRVVGSPRRCSAVTSAYCRMNRAAARQSSRPWTAAEPVELAAAVTPRSDARSSRSRSSCAKPRVRQRRVQPRRPAAGAGGQVARRAGRGPPGPAPGRTAAAAAARRAAPPRGGARRTRRSGRCGPAAPWWRGRAGR